MLCLTQGLFGSIRYSDLQIVLSSTLCMFSTLSVVYPECIAFPYLTTFWIGI